MKIKAFLFPVITVAAACDRGLSQIILINWDLDIFSILKNVVDWIILLPFELKRKTTFTYCMEGVSI